MSHLACMQTILSFIIDIGWMVHFFVWLWTPLKSAHKLGKESFANIEHCYTNKSELKGAMANEQFQKISRLPTEKKLEFPRGWRFSKTKKSSETHEAQLAYSGWEGLRKKSLLWGRYGHFLELHDLKCPFPQNIFFT